MRSESKECATNAQARKKVEEKKNGRGISCSFLRIVSKSQLYCILIDYLLEIVKRNRACKIPMPNEKVFKIIRQYW